MRITARLDDESEHDLELIQGKKGFKTVTDVLKYALKEVANQLEQQDKPGEKMKNLLQSDFVGSFKGPEALSQNYKEVVANYLDEKHPDHAK